MIYRFAGCEVDTRLLEIRRGGSLQQLDPLEFDLLVYLIENRDRVVTRRELLDTLWPGKVVTDSALSSRLKGVRAAVGDTGAAQRVIGTVHGRGYRFVVDVDGEARSAPAPDLRAAATRAVGREAELGKLCRWQQLAASGSGQVVLVCGAAGVGKTTLVRAFADTLRDQSDLLVLQGQCINQRGANEAYLPLLEALARTGQDEPAFGELLGRHAPAWFAHLPALHREAMPAPAGVTPGRMLLELSDVLRRVAADRDVLVLIEDLHWSDPSTIDWLAYHARRNDAGRLVVLVTARPEFEQRAVLAELVTRGHLRDIALDVIEEAAMTEYLERRLGASPAPELAALTYRRTRGFPMFFEALVDHWLANGLVHRTGGAWCAADGEAELLAGVPDTLAQLIDQQLDRLDENERTWLETAALAGSPFSAAMVAAALDAAGEEVENAFARMARAPLFVRRAGEREWPDGTISAAFEFIHELYRDALYERIPAARRARLHAAAGEWMVGACGDDVGPWAGEIAEHFAHAHDAERALTYFYPAAVTAFSRSANRETLAIVERALALLETLPATAETKKRARSLHLLRANALGTLEGWGSAEMEASFRRARDLAREVQPGDGTPEILGLAIMQEVRGCYEKSEALLQGLLEEQPAVGLEAYELLACSLFHQGRFAESRSYAERAVEEYDPGEVSAILARYGENPGVCCHGWAALDLWFTGHADTALHRSDDAIGLAQEHSYSLSTALTHRAFLHQFRNEPGATADWAERARGVAERQGFGFRIVQSVMLGAWARGRLAADDAERRAALDTLDTGIRAYRESGAEMAVPYYRALQAEILVALGRHDEALELLEAGIARCAGRGFFYEAEMCRLAAAVLQERHAHDRATEMLERASRLARAQDARFLQVRTGVTRLAQARDQRARQACRGELDRALGTLTEGRETPDWEAARAALA